MANSVAYLISAKCRQSFLFGYAPYRGNTKGIAVKLWIVLLLYPGMRCLTPISGLTLQSYCTVPGRLAAVMLSCATEECLSRS